MMQICIAAEIARRRTEARRLRASAGAEWAAIAFRAGTFWLKRQAMNCFSILLDELCPSVDICFTGCTIGQYVKTTFILWQKRMECLF
jgi:hypothetical protein